MKEQICCSCGGRKSVIICWLLLLTVTINWVNGGQVEDLQADDTRSVSWMDFSKSPPAAVPLQQVPTTIVFFYPQIASHPSTFKLTARSKTSSSFPYPAEMSPIIKWRDFLSNMSSEISNTFCY